MKKLIVVCGERNVGKTTVLNDFAKRGMLKNMIKQYNKSSGHMYGDIVCLVDFNNKKIGIVSKGDLIRLIDEGYNYIRQYLNSIDVLVCICHKSAINYIIKKYGKNSAIVIPKMVYNKNDNALCLNEIIGNI